MDEMTDVKEIKEVKKPEAVKTDAPKKPKVVKPQKPKNTIRMQLTTAMEGKDKVGLKDIYAAIKAKPENIRAVLNAGVKAKKYFERCGLGEYKLKKA